MILLDTTVLSEPMKPLGDPAVLRWLDAQAIETLFIAAIGLAELRFGIAALPKGRRRDELSGRLDRDLLPLFHGRILPFENEAAVAYAELRARAREVGKAIATVDGYIAAIAASRGLIVATRDTSPFEAAGLDVINPWTAPPS